MFDQQKNSVILLTWSKSFLKVDRLLLALSDCECLMPKLEWLHYFHTVLGHADQTVSLELAL